MMTVSGITAAGAYQYRLELTQVGCTTVTGTAGTLNVVDVASLSSYTAAQLTLKQCNETVVGNYLPMGYTDPASPATTTWAWTMGTPPPGVTAMGGTATTGTTSSISTQLLNLNNFVRSVPFTVTPTTTLNTVSCVGSPATITVEVNPTPVLTGMNPNGDLTLCQDEERVISASAVANLPRYTWTILSGATATGITLNGQTSPQTTTVDYVAVKATGAGTFTVQVSVSDSLG